MEKIESPFRLFFLVILSIIIFASLIWLYNHIQNDFFHSLLTIGIGLGVIWLAFIAMALNSKISNTNNERKNRIYQEQASERLKEHQIRFYCHICGKPSPQPAQFWEDNGENGQLYNSILVTDKNQPTELVRCSLCQKWTCSNTNPPNLVYGICKKCLETPPIQE